MSGTNGFAAKERDYGTHDCVENAEKITGKNRRMSYFAKTPKLTEKVAV